MIYNLELSPSYEQKVAGILRNVIDNYYSAASQ